MPDEKGPLISVIMGILYRRSDLSLLQRAVKSVLDQSLGDFELLISDDGSTAEAKSFLEALAQKDGRVRLLRGCRRQDLAAKLNYCLAAAKGRYIARMDDDDHSQPERFEKQLAYLESHPETAFVGCWAELIRDGKKVGERRPPERPGVKNFCMTQPFLHPALLFRREALEAVGGYCEEKRCFGCEDYDLLLRLYEAGYLGANLPEALLQYRLPPLGEKRRPMRLCLYEARTRYTRFRSLGLLPGKLPYVVKPVAVRLLPQKLLEQLKDRRRACGGY